MFENLEALPGDKLLAITAAYRADPNPAKVDLGVGVYRDSSGKTPIMAAIAEAEKRLGALEDTKAYLSPKGWPGFFEAIFALYLGDTLNDAVAPRLAGLQAPGGTGALRLGADLVKAARPDARVWLSNPTWANHNAIFSAVGVTVEHYPYYDRENSELQFDGMLAALSNAKAGDVVLIHGCCHNPTGADLDASHADALIALFEKTGATPFIDAAYQGFGLGLEEDATLARRLIEALPEAVVTYSCSKNFGLYRERTGAVGVFCQSEANAAAVQTQLAFIARRNYSMPPSHGAGLATVVLEDPALKAQWRDELAAMTGRVNDLRASLSKSLAEAFSDNNRFSFIEGQRGMFTMLPLSPEEVAAAREKHSVYMAGDGRINVAGLTEDVIPAVAAAIRDVSA